MDDKSTIVLPDSRAGKSDRLPVGLREADGSCSVGIFDSYVIVQPGIGRERTIGWSMGEPTARIVDCLREALRQGEPSADFTA